jgi:hypothetical protein
VRVLKEMHGVPGFPLLMWEGYYDDNFSMIIELLGTDLGKAIHRNKTFSIPTTMRLMS